MAAGCHKLPTRLPAANLPVVPSARQPQASLMQLFAAGAGKPCMLLQSPCQTACTLALPYKRTHNHLFPWPSPSSSQVREALGGHPYPLIWTADFILDTDPATAADAYRLGELNASCVGFTTHLELAEQVRSRTGGGGEKSISGVVAAAWRALAALCL